LPATKNNRTAPIGATDEWDAGELGCGELVLELRKKLRRIPGGVLKVVALDPAAPIDLPAWCRLTRNELVDHDPRTHAFWIRSRLDWS
jgi:tRNA 2-thiouridine synthesizing protein A